MRTILFLLAVAVGAGCSGGGTKSATLTVQGLAFPPITVEKGAEIKLVNKDAEPHTMTADDGSFASKAFTRADPQKLKAPTKPGAYPFHCTVHPSMHGTLTVK
jgi:plastocyanin